MKTIYVLSICCPYEGCEAIEVFDCEEKAQGVYVIKTSEAHKNGDYYNYKLEEFEISE